MIFPAPRHRFTELRLLPLSLKLGGFTSEIIGWGFFEPTWWRNYPHTHTFFEICCAYQGWGTFRMLGKNYRVGAGDVFIAKPAELHEIISSQEDPMGIYFWSYTLVPPRSRKPEEGPVDALLDAFMTSRIWVSRRAPGMERTLELLTEEIARKEPGYPRVIEGLVAKLILDTARAAVDSPLPSESVDPPARSQAEAIVQRAVRFLRDNYAGSIGVRDVAAQVNLSERHVNRLFRRVMGMPILEYLTRLRIETASQLLLNKRLPIKEVAHTTGYPDVHYFMTLFRRRTGLTPGVYREKGGTQFLKKRSP